MRLLLLGGSVVAHGRLLDGGWARRVVRGPSASHRFIAIAALGDPGEDRARDQPGQQRGGQDRELGCAHLFVPERVLSLLMGVILVGLVMGDVALRSSDTQLAGQAEMLRSR